MFVDGELNFFIILFAIMLIGIVFAKRGHKFVFMLGLAGWGTAALVFALTGQYFAALVAGLISFADISAAWWIVENKRIGS